MQGEEATVDMVAGISTLALSEHQAFSLSQNGLSQIIILVAQIIILVAQIIIQ